MTELAEGLLNHVNVAPALARSLHLTMLRIRLFEERVADLYEAHEIHTPVHLYIGQEAVAAGVCAALHTDDYIFGNHRSHGHYLAKGGDMRALMAEIYCKATGCSHGRGGSMHLIAPKIGLLGTVPMVAATIPIAVGAALSAQLRSTQQVSVAFFGDGATEEGAFHEAINFASLMKLPVIFVCENNLFSSHLPIASRRTTSALYTLVEPYGIPAMPVDGNDVVAVYEAACAAVEHARAGKGPTFLEFNTYRWRGHVGPSWDLDVGIRDRAELEAWMARCPVTTFEQRLLDAGVVSQADLVKTRTAVTQQIDDSVRFARESPAPKPEATASHVFIANPTVPYA